MLRLMISRRWWTTTLLVLVAIGLTVRLGFWQVGRYHQNKAFADHLAAMQVAAPIVIESRTQQTGLTAMEYRAVQATGTFDFTRQIAIRNQVWEQSWGNETGFKLVTPLVFPDQSAVLVDRGWIPLKDDTPVAWRDFDVPGQVTVTGIIRLPASPGMGGQVDPTLAPGQTKMDFWNFVNLERLQYQLPYTLLPVYIQAGGDSDSSRLPYRSLSSPEETPADTNAGFASMWFGFTALLFFGYPVYLKKHTPDTSGCH